MKNINFNADIPCFFMICTSRTEKECIERGLFGDKEWRLPYLKFIKEGDIGFLINVSNDELIGIFIAESRAQLNIVPEAWDGQFPAQIKVKIVGEIQRINNASSKLEKFMNLRIIKRSPYTYKIPINNTYGPEITNQVLALFEKIPENIFYRKNLSEVDIFTEFTLNDVAGLNEVKDFIYQRIIAPFEDEELAYRLRLKIGGGILLFGPPGTGKTLIATAIAKSIEAKFIEISPSFIMGYPGEAEKKLENIFHALEKEPRAVLFLDEAEWILTKREDLTSSVMQRVTPLLLSQLSKIFRDKTKPIIVIAATNKPYLIDSAFLRPGRFDKIFYIGLPNMEARKEIIKLQLRERDHSLTEEDINKIAEKLEGYSGADIEQIIEESAFLAFQRRDKITESDILTIIENTPKSVSDDEIEQIEKWARERGLIK